MKRIIMSAVIIMTAGQVMAADGRYSIKMANGGFYPSSIEIPANQKAILLVSNEEKYKTEFESYSLGREQVIKPGKTEEIFLDPLKAGTYEFFDCFNQDAKGQIIVK